MGSMTDRPNACNAFAVAEPTAMIGVENDWGKSFACWYPIFLDNQSLVLQTLRW